MARFMADFYVDRPDADQFIAFVSQDFFGKEGYQYVNFKGENVWKKGVGALAAPQFIKLEYMGGCTSRRGCALYGCPAYMAGRWILPGRGDLPLRTASIKQ